MTRREAVGIDAVVSGQSCTPAARQATLMRHRFDAENLRGRTVEERKGKTRKHEAPQIGINGLTNLGMLKQ